LTQYQVLIKLVDDQVIEDWLPFKLIPKTRFDVAFYIKNLTDNIDIPGIKVKDLSIEEQVEICRQIYKSNSLSLILSRSYETLF
jgi:hypothetical protein